LVLGTLGVGGMGVVFSAYDPQLDRKVALKLLRAAAATSLGGTQPLARKAAVINEASARLRREAQAIARLSHPHVVAVYDVGATEDGDVYIAMEFIEGENLSSWLRAWPRPWTEILETFLQAARGLAAAHDVGLLHRDFKPDNVLVGENGRVRVGDFGLARSVLLPDEGTTTVSAVTSLQGSLTATGTVLGTPRYMAPEQLTGQQVDSRSDQFSFCVALYEALFGRHPLPGNSAVSMLEHKARAVEPVDSKVAVDITRAIMRGLEPDPNKRFPSMNVLIASITPPPLRRRWPLVAAGLAGLLVLTGLGLAAVARNQRQNANDNEVLLSKRIDSLESDKSKLEARLQEYALQQNRNVAEIDRLKIEIGIKKAEINQLLIEKIGAAKSGSGAATSLPTPRTARDASATSPNFERIPAATGSVFFDQSRSSPPPRATHSAGDINASLTAGYRNLASCFREWSARVPGESAQLLVTATLAMDGSASNVMATGVDDVSLPLCVQDAVKMVAFTPTLETVDIRLAVIWDGQKVRTGAETVKGVKSSPQALTAGAPPQ
jgi:serine/threonine protein kinase